MTSFSNKIIQTIRRRLKENSDEKTRVSGERFFKHAIKSYGVKSAVVGKIAREGYRELKGKSKGEIFGLCDLLFRSGYMEEAFVACEWSYNQHKRFEPKDFKTLESWVARYIDNWAKCDTFCNHTVGAFVEMYPAYLSVLKKWARSKNLWVRRASAVSLIIPARHGKFIKDVFEIADILLLDSEDMVQKGYGWMLKAASQAHQREVFNYVMKHKAKMPRTALRYAIEKMPKVLKAKAMQK
jgi:3-methyladenine DNA glycosylase AlkD